MKTTGDPVFTKFRSLALDCLAATKQMFAEVEDMSLCQKAFSPWSSLLYIIQKRDGSLRSCGKAFEHTDRTRSPATSNIAYMTTYLQNAKVFSMLDLIKGLIKGFLGDLPSVYVTWMTCLSSLPLTRNTSFTYAMGSTSYNRMAFKSATATNLVPLYASLKGKAKDLMWGPLQELAFCNAKNALGSSGAITFSVPYASLLVSNNASNAVLKQVVNDSPCPLSFISRKLSKVKSRYYTFNCELLALHLSLSPLLRRYALYRSHRPHGSDDTFTRQCGVCTTRQSRHLSAVAEYNYTLQQVPKKMNYVANDMSRNTVAHGD
ncbi:uncharacterized protein [Palaemon carinicauda]|uniref:uncharacterized protein n=1 Tax=Palaemon carinicauda TaxID=392227 RepID=UPI0035B5B937